MLCQHGMVLVFSVELAASAKGTTLRLAVQSQLMLFQTWYLQAGSRQIYHATVRFTAPQRMAQEMVFHQNAKQILQPGDFNASWRRAGRPELVKSMLTSRPALPASPSTHIRPAAHPCYDSL
jgi:hypothetical protein